MKDKRTLFCFCMITALLLFNGCSWFDDSDDGSDPDGSGNNGNLVTVTVSPSSATLVKGTTRAFSATVTNSSSQSVTWSVEGNFSSATAISQDGVLSVGSNESAGTLTVKATWYSYEGDTASGTAAVTVSGNSGNLVTVTVSPSSATLAKGGTRQFSATVANSSSQSVTWSVEGNSSSATAISQYGMLSVAGNESAGTLTVKATWFSYYSGETVSGTATVTVSGNSGNLPVTVTVSPSSATLVKGTTQEFSATVTNSSSQSVTWSVEGNFPSATTISQYGVLSVGSDESAGTLTVRATWSSTGKTVSGTAVITVAAEADIPSNLKITRPGETEIALSWSAVNNAAKYKIFRLTNDIPSYYYLNDAFAASYTDTAVTAGSSYYYKVSAVVNGMETGESAVVFGFALPHFRLPANSSPDSYPINLPANSKHYYRLVVSAGQSYVIAWEDGSGHNAGSYVQCSAWQNDGTLIFADAQSGYTSPKIFTATATGYVTVEVKNTSGSSSYDYQVYYF
jgi:uncharacterized protein (DUF427 family)